MTTVTTTPLDKEDVRRAAQQYGMRRVMEEAGLPADCLDGRHHPCPKCGGTDRFRVIDEGAGAVYCNACFNRGNGDIFAVVAWLLGVEFVESVRIVADIVGYRASTNGSTNGKPPSDAIEQLATAKGCPVASLRAYGAQPSKYDTGAAAIPMYGPDGKICSGMKATPNRKQYAKGKPVGLFLPHENGAVRLPQPGETWLVVEGAFDAAAAHEQDYPAAGLPGCQMANKFPVLFRDVDVVLVPDLDTAGIEGAEKTAARLKGVAKSVKIARLPGEIKPSGGDDLRDILKRPDGEKLVRDAIDNAREWEPPASDATGKGFRPNDLITNAEEVAATDSDKIIYLPLSMDKTLKQARRVTDNWPRRCGNLLFTHEKDDENNNVHFFDRNAAQLFGYWSHAGTVRWMSKTGCITKSEIFERLKQVATNYAAVETLPHHPPLPGHYYAHPEITPGDGDRLRELVARFNPETDIDADLILTAFLTPFWGGAGGERPAFLVTADAGRGVGKTSLVEAIAQLAGGAVGFTSRDDIAQMKTRLLTPDAMVRRVATLDNVKSAKFSWAELEGLITAPAISGHRMYSGDASRPNTLTFMLTINSPSAATDLAQRSVVVKLAKPKRSANWATATRKFIQDNQQQLVADAIGILQGEKYQFPKYSRWASWERDVLAVTPEPEEAQRVIAERQVAIDSECEEAGILEDYFGGRLRGLGYTIDRDVVHIPSGIAAEWYSLAMNERASTRAVGRQLKQMFDEGRLKLIQPNPSRAHGRGMLWVGPDASPSDSKFIDLAERLKEQSQ